MHTILVIGGYGFFGRRICQALSKNRQVRLIIAGRSLTSAQALAVELGLPSDQAVAMDIHAPNLAQQLSALDVNTLIHTAGPFQGQDYTVAQAAIEAGAHYIDLADGRDFVAGIAQLNQQAHARGVLVTSGASSLPALSSAVVDRYLPYFSRLLTIRLGIGSGAKAPGVATMSGVFSYCGKPFERLENGRWKTVYGWLDTLRYRFPPPVGNRLLGACDVPDLTLFPQRYQALKSISFHAGFASAMGHMVVWLGATLVRLTVMKSLTTWVTPLHWLSEKLERFVSDKGAMFVSMEGVGLDGLPLKLQWHLLAAQNHGPYIPCGAAIALATKLAEGQTLPVGAMPCMGLLTVNEYLGALQGLNIQELPPL